MSRADLSEQQRRFDATPNDAALALEIARTLTRQGRSDTAASTLWRCLDTLPPDDPQRAHILPELILYPIAARARAHWSTAATLPLTPPVTPPPPRRQPRAAMTATRVMLAQPTSSYDLWVAWRHGPVQRLSAPTWSASTVIPGDAGTTQLLQDPHTGRLFRCTSQFTGDVWWQGQCEHQLQMVSALGDGRHHPQGRWAMAHADGSATFFERDHLQRFQTRTWAHPNVDEDRIWAIAQRDTHGLVLLHNTQGLLIFEDWRHDTSPRQHLSDSALMSGRAKLAQDGSCAVVYMPFRKPAGSFQIFDTQSRDVAHLQLERHGVRGWDIDPSAQLLSTWYADHTLDIRHLARDQVIFTTTLSAAPTHIAIDLEGHVVIILQEDRLTWVL